MTLRASQIAVRAASRDALRDALDRALRRQKPAPRRLLAALADGWAAIVEEGRPEADGGLARLLSELLGEAIAVDLDGASLSLNLRSFRDGEPRELPQQAALRGAPFADVEAVAWDALRALGVPAALRLCDAETLRALDDPGDDAGFEALVATSPPPAVRDARAVPPERAESPSPPAEPDLWVESAAGEQCALVVRALRDVPATAEVAEALASIEEAQAIRLAEHLGQADDERLSRVSFSYGGAAAALQPLLSRARASRPRLMRYIDAGRAPPLSRAGFTQACRAAIEAALPGAPVLRAHALRVEVASPEPGVSLRAPAAAEYAKYLNAADEPSDPAAGVVDAVRTLLAGPSRPLADLDADAFAKGLLPTVVLGEVDPLRATAPLAGPLRAALLHDDGARIAAVPLAAIERHGLSFEAALTLAVDQTEARTLSDPLGISWFDLDEGRVVVFDFDDPAGAGRVLSRQARAALNDLLGEPCLCTVPTRDALLACSMLEPEAIRWVEEESARRAAEGPHGLSAALLVIDNDGVRLSTAASLLT